MADGENGFLLTPFTVPFAWSAAYSGFVYSYVGIGGQMPGEYPLNSATGDVSYETDGCKITLMDEANVLTAEQRGILREFMANASGDGTLASVFKDCADDNNVVEFHFDTLIHYPDGTTKTWDALESTLAPNEILKGINVSVKNGTNSIISISLNPQYLKTDIEKFKETLVHEFLHILWPGNEGHARIDPLVPRVVEAVFGEDNSQDYYDAGKIIGTESDDNLTGGIGFNDISGGGGNDTITGGPTDDYVDGGPGDDYISTGAGNDYIIPGPAGSDAGDVLKGGLGDDVYVMMTAANVRTVDDEGGYDGIYIDTDVTASVFHSPINDNIYITGLQTYSVIIIVDGDGAGKIEWVEMADHTQLNITGYNQGPYQASSAMDLSGMDPKLAAALSLAGAFDGIYEAVLADTIMIAGDATANLMEMF